MSLSPTSKSNSCAICEDTTGKCRQSREDSDYWQCMIYADAKKGEVISGYRCLGHSKDNLWGQFRLDNSQDWTQQQQLEWRRENQRRQQRKVKEDEQRRRRSLSAVERDKGYQQLFSELILHPDDKADLVRRGFSHAQIELSGFCSVKAYQQLQGRYSELLPGIIGGKVIVSNEGYLCPVRNTEGLIVACQVRLRSLPEGDKNRYRWLSTKEQTLQIDGELPLAIFPSGVSSEVVALAEGIGTKPFLVSQRLGLTTIGAAGGQFFSSPNALKKGIGDARSVWIFPDAGDVANRSVMTRWQKVAELLKDWGYEVKFGWWNQVDKTHPDVDELENLSTIEYINPDEFFNLGQSSTTTQGLSSPDNAPDWKRKQWDKWRKWRSLTGATHINSRYIDAKLPQDGMILGIKSGTGTGKTTLLKKLVNEWRNQNSDVSFLCPGYRNSLLRQLAEILKIQHIHEDDIRIMSKEPGSGVAFCIQSLSKMAAMQEESFANKVVLLDEIMSTLRDLITGKTVKKRTKAIELFKQMCKEARAIIIMDATLADWGVNLIKHFAPNKQVTIIENTYKGDKGKLNFLLGTMTEEVDKIKKNDRSPYLELALEALRPLISSDSQIFLEALDRLLTAMGKKVMRVDSKTIGNSEVKDFLKDSNTCVLEYKPQSLLYSPSAESGLDISTKGYFSHHFGFFFGVLGVDAIIQMMGRLRDPDCEKYVWIKEYGNIGENAVTKSLKDLILNDLDSSIDNEESLRIIHQTVHQLIKGSGGIEIDTANMINEMANFEKANLRACAREAFVDAGYKVTDRTLKSFEKRSEQEREVKEEIKVETSELIFKAEQIPVDGEDDWKKLEALKMSENLEDRWKLENAFLRKRLPGIEKSEAWTPELIYLTKFKDRAFITHAEVYWLLQNPDIAKSHAAKKFCDLSQQDKIFIPDYQSQWSMIYALQKMGIQKFVKFLTEGGELHENSLEVKALANLAPRYENELGIKLTSQKGRNIKYVSNLLRKLGMKLKTTQKRVARERTRIYQIDSESLNNPLRLAVLNCIDTKWRDTERAKSELEIAQNSALANLGEKQPQTESGNSFEGVTLIANNVYTKVIQCDSKEEEKAKENLGDLTSSNVAIEVAERSEVEPLAKAFESCDTVEVLAPETNNTTELLAESLSTVKSVEEFQEIAEWYEPTELLDAIAASASLPLRSKLRRFYESLRGAIAYPWGNQSKDRSGVLALV